MLTSGTLTTISILLEAGRLLVSLPLEHGFPSPTSWVEEELSHTITTLTFIKVSEELLSEDSLEVHLATLNSAIDKSFITLGLLRDLEEDIQSPCHSQPPIFGNIKVLLQTKISTNGDEL